MNDFVKVEMIPIESITVVNPRERNLRIHQAITENIDAVGLKRPITIRRLEENGKYALVCGQGRLESLMMLGQSTVPAIIIDVDQETGHVMSLVENIARRLPRASETLEQVGILHQRGYSDAEIGYKVGYSTSWVKNVVHLLEKGERKLLAAAEAGFISLHLAYEISRVDDAEAQLLIYAAYENGELNGKKISVVRKILEQRGHGGKSYSQHVFGASNPSKKLNADELAKMYQEHTEKHRNIQKRAERAQNTILLAQQIFKDLYSNNEFVELLKAEKLDTIPKPLANSVLDGEAL